MSGGWRRARGTAGRVLSHPAALLSVAFLTVAVVVSLTAQWLLPLDPLYQDLPPRWSLLRRPIGSAPTSWGGTSWRG